MNRHAPLAVGLTVGAAIGYGRMRRRFPIADLPLRLRIRAALTMPPMRPRFLAARAVLLGGSVVFNVDLSQDEIVLRAEPAVVACCTLHGVAVVGEGDES